MNQLKGEYKCESLGLLKYFNLAKALNDKFEELELEYIPRVQNFQAKELAQTASGYKVLRKGLQKLIEIRKPLAECNIEVYHIDEIEQDDWQKEIVHYLQNPSSSHDRKLIYRVIFYTILGGEL